MTPQAKKLMTNIGIGALILAILVAGYLVFIKKSDTTTPGVVTSTSNVAQAVAISSNISRTKTELSELKKAVASSVEVFSSNEFRSLQDFSQQIPEEPIGRDNPFMATSWKVKNLAAEAATSKNTSSGGGSNSSTVGSASTPTAGAKVTTGI